MIKKILKVSAARWFIVGSATFLIDTSLFLIAFKLTEIAVVSNLFSGTIATTFFVFLFLGTSLVSFLIHSGFHPLPAKVGTAAFTAPISFFIMKFVTFRKTSNEA